MLSTELNEWHRQRNFEVCRVGGKEVYAGYHYLVHLTGYVEAIRPESERGQHCPQGNMNNRAVAVCYVGGLASDGKTPKDTRTPEQKVALEKLVKELKGKYPQAQVIGHRDVAPKACPSFDAKREYK